MGQPGGHGEAALRGTIGEGGPSLPPSPTVPAQLGPGSLGLCGAQWCPYRPLPAHQPAVGPRPGIEQAPGNARPWWEGLGLPLTVLRALRVPCKVWPSQWGERTPGQARPLPQLGQACSAPRPSGPCSPQPPQSLISPHPLNSWRFQGNYLMNQQCGDCGGRTAGNGPFSQH